MVVVVVVVVVVVEPDRERAGAVERLGGGDCLGAGERACPEDVEWLPETVIVTLPLLWLCRLEVRASAECVKKTRAAPMMMIGRARWSD